MQLNRTGIFATEEETQSIKDAMDNLRHTPLIALNSEHAIYGDAKEGVHKLIYNKALKHGLPEIEGYYGFDIQNGEFIKP